MSLSLPGVLFGYHGCDRSLVNQLVLGQTQLRPSTNAWDWLGDGAYFWEHDPQRAFDFACDIRDRPHRHQKHKIKEPAVVGALILPGRCLNLLDARRHEVLRHAHDALVATFERKEKPLPSNEGGDDEVQRNLDCAVIEMVHKQQQLLGGAALQTVRAAFFEGQPLYHGAHFADKSHIQIAVRDPACILGYFCPRDATGEVATFIRSETAE